MPGEQAFSLSMNEKNQGEGSRRSDEMWSELSNPHGWEFDLPNLANPISANENDNRYTSAELAVSPFQLFDVPIGIDEAFLRAAVDPYCGGNLRDSVQSPEKIAPVVLSTCLADNENGLSEENNLFDIPIVGGLSLNFDIDAFLKNQDLEVVESSDLPTLSSVTSLCPETNPTNGHLSIDGQMLGSGILQPAQNQLKDVLVAQNMPWSGSNDFTINNSFRNEGGRVPITTNTGHFTRAQQAHDYFGPVHENNTAYATRIPPVTVPTPMNNEWAAQPFGLGHFQAGHPLSYAGNDGGREFTSYGAFGGPVVGFHENPVPAYLNLGTVSADAFPPRLGYGHPWVGPEKRMRDDFFSNNGKGKLPLDDAGKQEWGGSRKRFKHGTSELGNTAENNNSSPAIVHNVIMHALDALKDIPSQAALMRPRQLVFKEPPNSSNPEK